jgi:hypothetical protein
METTLIVRDEPARKLTVTDGRLGSDQRHRSTSDGRRSHIGPTLADEGHEWATSKLTFVGERAATDIRRSKRVPFQVSSS